jgi:hypothetical protein
MQLPPETWEDIIWCLGTKGELVSRFTHARIRPAHLVGCGVPTAPQQRDYWRSEPWPELTVLAEWPDGEAEPTKIWFANPRRHTARASRPSRQTALAHRTRQPAARLARAGTRPQPLRGPRLAWLSSPCEFVHRGLRLSARGTLDAFPLRQQPTGPRARRPTQDLHPSRQPSKDPRGIPQTPSPPCASASASAWLKPCRDVHAVCGFGTKMAVCDTVELRKRKGWRVARQRIQLRPRLRRACGAPPRRCRGPWQGG